MHGNPADHSTNQGDAPGGRRLMRRLSVAAGLLGSDVSVAGAILGPLRELGISTLVGGVFGVVLAYACGLGNCLNSFGVALFTPTSVAWAERIVATSSSRAFSKSSSQ